MAYQLHVCLLKWCNMNILLLGTDSFSILALKTIVSQKYNVVAFITHSKSNNQNRLKDIAAVYNIPFYVVDNINSEESLQLIKQLNPDIIFSVHFDRILKPNIFSLANKYAVNLHPSLLPKYRGLSPFQSVLRNGDKETAITIHFITENVDEGNIVEQKIIPLSKDMYLFDLYILMMQNYPEVILSALNKLQQDNYKGVPQSRQGASYFGLPKKEDYVISCNESILSAYNKIRAYSKPDKGAVYDKFIIWEADIEDTNHYNKPHYDEINDYLFIYFPDGKLKIKKEQYCMLDDNSAIMWGGGYADIVLFYDKIDNIRCLIDYIYLQNIYLETNMYEKNILLYNDLYFFILAENILFLIIDYKSYYKIYFWSSKAGNIIVYLGIINHILKNKPSIIEILYKKNIDNYILQELLKHNKLFNLYGGIIRLKKQILQADIVEQYLNIVCASENDMQQIIALHSKIFNKYIDRELNIKELQTLICEGKVLLYKSENEIAGCLIYSNNRKIFHLRYWFVNKEVLDQKGVGKALLTELYKIAGIGNYIEAWCRKDNKHAYNIYIKYGFKEDGLESDIFTVINDNINIEKLIPLN